MSIIKAIILGIIQGLTEFLPVSSSGHIELVKALWDIDFEDNLLFTTVVHFATALSTLVVFRKDVWSIIKGAAKLDWNDDLKLVSKIIVSMIPAVVIGLLFEDELEELLSGKILLVGIMLLVTALLLFIADKAKDTNKEITFSHAILIGLAQAIALLPGLSRSGSTISTSVLLGSDKTKAARFSFLMVVPLILGKISKDIIYGEVSYESETFTPLVVGFIAAFIVGVIACTWMISLVRNSKLSYFSIYCVIVGLAAILGHFIFL